MRFMILVKGHENAGPPPRALMDAIEASRQEEANAGRMIETGGLLPTAMGTRIRLRKGALNATDGPFSESKEVIGGFAIMEFESKKEALDAAMGFMELHRQHWPDWEGEAEVRQMFDGA